MALFTLGAGARAAGYRLEGYERVGSTNSEAMDAARGNQPGLLWVASLEQTAGRGRRGREWHSQYGNLAASLYLTLHEEILDPGILGFVAGIALMRALTELMPACQNDLALKWPNDVLYKSAKLVGILLEAEKRPDGGLAIIIGMGVNVAHIPADLPYAAARVFDFEPTLSAPEILQVLTDKWVDCYTLWDSGRGNAAILREWRENAAGIGSAIRVKLQNETIDGLFETIDDRGRLCVRLKDKSMKLVTAGDVYFGPQPNV